MYNSKEEGQAQVDVKDLLGKIIYTNFINKGIEFIIPLKDYNNGVYIISITRSKELLYKTKLIKQD